MGCPAIHTGKICTTLSRRGVKVNPVLQELLQQLQQRQISFAEFRADLQGLCKMSPGLISAAGEMLETAVAGNHIAPDQGRALLQTLNPEMQPAATLLRPEEPASGNALHDKTVLMNPSASGSIAPTAEATVALNRPSADSADATRVMEPHAAAPSVNDTASPQAVIEKTQRIERSSSAVREFADNKQHGDLPPVQAGVERTQRIERDVAPQVPEKTQRIARSDASPPAKNTQQLVSHLGTMERFATDGPLPPTIDMGPIPFGPGTVIKERFLLKDQIGSGGMGVVYSAIDRRKTEARDPNPLVAIKILGADFARHPKSLIALQREARKAQELAHPNVATVFDFDREGDAVYMTMELLQGRSLDGFTREIRGKGVGRDVAWPIIRGMAQGLAYAHRRGLVHSDLKPANIFLTEDGTPKLLDFGIARAVPSRISKQTVKDIFDAGSLGAYTVPYATEEMVAGGEPHPADDVYALGLISYELLGGAHPYKRQGAAEARKLGMKPAPIKGLPRREWRTIERAISFDRSRRPQDADAFLKALSGITRLQKGLMAATVVLAMAAGYFAYSSYREAGPDVPFSALPAATQQQIKSYMSDGDKLWSFYVKDKNIFALQEAAEQYAGAYDLHPRDRDAVQALRRVADAALKATRDDPVKQRELARSLAERSTYLGKDYPPIQAIIHQQ